MELRDYQKKDILSIKQALKDGYKRILLQLPTGGGKTVEFSKIAESIVKQNKTCFIVMHRDRLIRQTSSMLDSIGVEHSYVAAGYLREPNKPVYICGVQTLVRRLDRLSIEPDVIIVDEAHHGVSNSYKKILDYYPNAKVLGFTATPERLDGKGLQEVFEILISNTSAEDLMKKGWLSKYEVYGSRKHLDTSKLRTTAGDFNKKDAGEMVDKPSIVGDAVKMYKKYATNKSGLAFCVSRLHAQHTTESFNVAGISAEYIGGDLKPDNLNEILERYENGETKILCSCDLIDEGFDVPHTEVVMLLRPTKSLVKHLQQIGRALRPSREKTHAIILDHVGNCTRVGLPDDIYMWSLEGKTKKDRKNQEAAIRARMCPECYTVHKFTPSCPKCGHVYETQGRQIEEEEGELEKLDTSILKHQRRMEQASARSFEDLLALGIKRGYTKRNAGIWARKVISARERRKR